MRPALAAKHCARAEHLSCHPQRLAAGQRYPGKEWNPSQRLQALRESHALSGETLHAWCREKGLFEHQLQAWREAFCTHPEPSARERRAVLRELQSKHEQLQRELRRKDKALAQDAALLMLQKKVPGQKYQVYWADVV